MRRIVIFLLVSVLASCTSQNPEIFLGDEACSIPCWYGLTPGQSTVAESQTILQSLPFVSSTSIETTTFRGVTSTRWSFVGEVAGGGTLIFDEEERIQEVRLRPLGLPLGMAIDVLGDPEEVFASYVPGETAGYHLTLYYPTKGLVVETYDQPKGPLDRGVERITRDLNVSLIQFYIPSDDIRTLLLNRPQDKADYILAHLQPWPGFGDDVIKIELP